MSEPKMSTCKSCGAPIIWAKVTKKDGGIGNMPFDPEPREDGTHKLFKREVVQDGVVEDVYVRAEWLGPRDRKAFVAEGGKLRTSHFSTCPEADQHRRGR